MDKSDSQSSTEQKILEAAKKVFIKKGMYGARMQEIADEANINKAMVHYYFRSKDQLFEAIFREAFQEFVPKVFGVLKENTSIEKKLRAFVANYIDAISKNPFIPLFIINEINQNPERLAQLTGTIGSIFGQLAQEIKEKVTIGEFREVDPVQLFASIISMTLFPFLARPIIQGSFDYSDDMYRQFMEERKKLIPDMILNYLKIKN